MAGREISILTTGVRIPLGAPRLRARVGQSVVLHLPKVVVAGSSPVPRSSIFGRLFELVMELALNTSGV